MTVMSVLKQAMYYHDCHVGPETGHVLPETPGNTDGGLNTETPACTDVATVTYAGVGTDTWRYTEAMSGWLQRLRMLVLGRIHGGIQRQCPAGYGYVCWCWNGHMEVYRGNVRLVTVTYAGVGNGYMEVYRGNVRLVTVTYAGVGTDTPMYTEAYIMCPTAGVTMTTIRRLGRDSNPP